MKLDALDHPKTLDFAARLNVSRPTAIGHLELFWHFVAKQAPQGNVGKFPDGAIARAADWNGDPEDFLKALLKSGLIDACETHRFLVHDWPEHCPNWVRAQLQKLKRPFYVVDSLSNDGTEEASYEGTGEPSTRARVPKGREGKGSQGKPSQGIAAPDQTPPVDSVDNSKGTEPGSLNGKNSPPEEPPEPRNGSPKVGASGERRNGDFESILNDVSKVIAAGVHKPQDYRGIARTLHISVLQAEVAVRQLRDRKRLPPGVAA